MAYRAPGVSEVIEEGKNGFTVEPMNRQKLVNVATKTLDMLPELSTSSRKIAENYSWEKCAKSWEIQLKSTIEKRHDHNF